MFFRNVYTQCEEAKLCLLKGNHVGREMVLRAQSWPGQGYRAERWHKNHSPPILLSVTNPESHRWAHVGGASGPQVAWVRRVGPAAM